MNDEGDPASAVPAATSPAAPPAVAWRSAPAALLAAAFAVVLLSGACGSGAPGAGTSEEGLSGTVTVLAAASLTEAFTAIGEAFEAEHPAARAQFSFGASSTLAHQAVEGAPGDVFAAADEASMARAVDGGSARDPKVFARNRLALLVEPGNPKGLSGLADLARPDVAFVVCAPDVPCGRFAAQALDRAGVEVRPRSYEENVKAVAAKVILGEADAGIVYVTDARAAGDDAAAVAIADVHNVAADYPIAVLEQSRRPVLARAFRDFVLSGVGREILARYGFLPP